MNDAAEHAGGWSAVEVVMREHLSLDEDQLFRAVRMVERDLYLTTDGLRDRSNDARSLDALIAAVRRLRPYFDDVSDGTSREVFRHFNTSAAVREDDRARLGNAYYVLAHKSREFLAALEGARRSLDDQAPTTLRTLKTINIAAIRCVGAAMEVWAEFQDRPPPARALNPASPFAAFLIDLMEACDIDGDPKAAFRAWAKTCGAEK